MTDHTSDHDLKLTEAPETAKSDNKQAQKERSRATGKSSTVRSDPGTIILHWTLTIAVFASLLTGLRLSADAEGAWFSKLFEPILPQGEIWTWHFLSALFVLGLIFAYTAYMSLARLMKRISMQRANVLTQPVDRKLKISALNVISYWLLFASVIALTVTGVLLYLGEGGLWVDVHYITALVVLGYTVVHIVLHYMYGGLQEWLRLFRPHPLRQVPGMASYPLMKSQALGAIIMAGVYSLDLGTRDQVFIASSNTMPTLDGDLSDETWSQARVTTVTTNQGSNLGGSGESNVEIRAVQVGDKIAFAFRWEDKTRSLKRHPVQKTEDGWKMLNNRGDLSDETEFYEDKFSVAFGKSDAYGGGGSTHMGPKPLSDKPGTFHERGLHYTTDGSLMDVWQWKASRGGMLGRVDDMWFGTPIEPKEAHIAGKARYSAGYDADKGKSFYVYNYVKQPDSNYKGPVGVKRLPKDYAAMNAKMGNINLSVEVSDDEGSQWWMFDEESVPYSEELDAQIPVGTVIPGVLITGTYEGSRADLLGGAKWADGHWTLEVIRDMDTGNEQDLAMEDGLFMYVSVFDHNQTRHTRHSRPIRLVLN
ncbi:ethylbenzene dehydrogenase-related protein [Roseibium sediminis]|uniref:ethylbenzene dehydrogenase-related protein n=1 Tax=Roseibium sediminis TaxID=1775174 RepID=UPI00123DCE24|nr:ethylbenzene dehydrogenase-related protein [Roseibium sediminis]